MPQRRLTDEERVAAKRRARQLNRARRKKRVVTWVRELWTVQDGKCRWCGIALPADFHLDHVVPVSKGGPHSRNNVALACPPCNLRKRATIPVSLFAFE